MFFVKKHVFGAVFGLNTKFTKARRHKVKRRRGSMPAPGTAAVDLIAVSQPPAKRALSSPCLAISIHAPNFHVPDFLCFISHCMAITATVPVFLVRHLPFSIFDSFLVFTYWCFVACYICIVMIWKC